MQTTEAKTITSNAAGSSAITRAQAFAGTLSSREAALLNRRGERQTDRRTDTFSTLTHDARNMVAALTLYSEILAEPGVLSLAARHHADELKLIAANFQRLVEKLSLLGARDAVCAAHPILHPAPCPDVRPLTQPVALSLDIPEQPIADLREELSAMSNLLSALAGPLVAVTVTAEEGAHPVWLTTEDLTRVLVNLVKNAGEAIQGASVHGAGRITITLREGAAIADTLRFLVLSVEDSGPGINPAQLDAIFDPGFTTNVQAASTQGAQWPSAHRGLGLFICRSIVEAAGGRIRASNRPEGGAHIEMELPIRPI